MVRAMAVAMRHDQRAASCSSRALTFFARAWSKVSTAFAIGPVGTVVTVCPSSMLVPLVVPSGGRV